MLDNVWITASCISHRENQSRCTPVQVDRLVTLVASGDRPFPFHNRVVSNQRGIDKNSVVSTCLGRWHQRVRAHSLRIISTISGTVGICSPDGNVMNGRGSSKIAYYSIVGSIIGNHHSCCAVCHSESEPSVVAISCLNNDSQSKRDSIAAPI